MDKAAFIDASAEDPWWLLGEDLGYQPEELRVQLGEALGHSDKAWFKDPNVVTVLYESLERDRYDLLQQVDEATDDTSRSMWLEEAIAALHPEEAEAAGAESEAALWDENHQMLYRLAADGTYLFARSDDHVTPTSEWMTQDEADMQQQEAASAGPAAEAPAAEAPAAWDENWQMLYRAASDGSYEYARSVDHVTPSSEWMTQDEAMAQRSAAAAEAPAGEAPAPAPEATEVLAEMTSNAAQFAEQLGISEDEAAALAADPEFQALLSSALADQN